MMLTRTRPRFIAFYLPQYHPIPENDKWWGRGFTEWRNVVNAKPLFAGHYQPHLPADLGFYDLRVPELRDAQAAMAQRYCIEGFCYWHYWFHGKRLLERPFNEVLASGKPELPFCLAWANETWSRRWLGEERDVLLEQTYSELDDLEHARWLLPVLADRRCIRVSGRPLFLVYRPKHLPNPKRTVEILRNESVRAGLPNPYLLGIDAHCIGFDCRAIGFDGTVRFEPQLGKLPLALQDHKSWQRFKQNRAHGVFSSELKIYDYTRARQLMNANHLAHPYFPSVFVGWDNTPRRGRKGVIVVDATPDRFAEALNGTVDEVVARSPTEPLVFLNAWNEWAEGNYLEPDSRWGLGFLEAVRTVVDRLPVHGSQRIAS